MASKYSAGRLLRLRLEAVLWITRPQSAFSHVPIALAAWSIGRGGGLQATDISDVLSVLLILVILQALMFTINDIFDATNDFITAPYMPIPSGIVSPRAATATASALGIALITLVLLAVPNRMTLVFVLAVIPFGLATFKLYSITKGYWFSPFFRDFHLYERRCVGVVVGGSLADPGLRTSISHVGDSRNRGEFTIADSGHRG